MRFRKRVKVFPGFYLNFSTSGISSTIGVRGASINFSKRGTYLNTGIPGTGFYDRQKIGDNKYLPESNQNQYNESTKVITPTLGEIKSAEKDQLTSTNLSELKKTLLEAYKDRIEISKEFHLTKKKLKFSKIKRVLACLFIFGLFIKSFKNKILILEEYLVDLTTQYNNCHVDIDIHFDDVFKEKYLKLSNSYSSLLTSQLIWDITSSIYQDRKVTRSAASTIIARAPVKFKHDNIDIIKSTFQTFHFVNKNGNDLYIYPAFVIVTSNKQDFALIDIKEFEIYFSESRFLEEQRVPTDTITVGRTWAKVNKNGQPDLRFKNNYQIPIVRYGELKIQSKSGLNEVYSFSSYEKSENFVNTFVDYVKALKPS